MDKEGRKLQLIEEARQGIEAESLTKHKVWRDSIKELETMYINAIRSGSWFKKRAREENCRRLQVLDDLVASINNKILTGEQALKRLETNNRDKQRGR